MNHETLQMRKENIAQNAVFFYLMNRQACVKINRKVAFYIDYSRIKSQNIVVTHPSPPYFLSPFFKTFVTHPLKINEFNTVVTDTPVLRP